MRLAHNYIACTAVSSWSPVLYLEALCLSIEAELKTMIWKVNYNVQSERVLDRV